MRASSPQVHPPNLYRSASSYRLPPRLRFHPVLGALDHSLPALVELLALSFVHIRDELLVPSPLLLCTLAENELCTLRRKLALAQCCLTSRTVRVAASTTRTVPASFTASPTGSSSALAAGSISNWCRAWVDVRGKVPSPAMVRTVRAPAGISTTRADAAMNTSPLLSTATACGLDIVASVGEPPSPE